ncbi:CRISPR-associated exonuclease Cas4 [Sulfobacillus thermosulfidooxidans DSM 9293]|uniref:CRISPR-associated exonuclease Cas4 n=2 Tax=Sulfobacillus thermosulfidooxidans TaxID=28034 RepID=A0A1W1WHS6_SULTA|nr:CRISPR-associated exonuclease Cas4 [Sulfobacillus thermosulfidooxidans DSM 9293]
MTMRQTRIPLSALNHFAYCPRRCALIHQEQVFEENQFTLEGRDHHQRVDAGFVRDGPIRMETAVHLWSEPLALTGIADVVEWHGDVPYPIEYKRGARHAWINDEFQVCAQGLCLEDMLHCVVPAGAIYYVESRRRREVVFTATLRDATRQAIEETRALLDSGRIPPPTDHRERCPNCSLIDLCLPALYGQGPLTWDGE